MVVVLVFREPLRKKIFT